MNKTILILGACGQIGTELTLALRQKYGNDHVVASDIRQPEHSELLNGPFEVLDASSASALRSVCEKHEIHTVYHLVAMLSATGEKFPMKAWDLNMQSLLHVLELAREKVIQKLFWPSSIAVFGPTTPKQNTPQQTVMEPSTVYGISKLAGERWCEYYFNKYGVDVRSLRYPGLISWKSQPGGGTTDYAVEIYYKAIENGSYESFLAPQTTLPMMYMEDAIRATLSIMDFESTSLKKGIAYNISAMSFNPQELGQEIVKQLPGFTLSYAPDFRQAIADSWPDSISDLEAQNDWHWMPHFNMEKMVQDMLQHLSP